MGVNDDLLDALTRHQIGLQRLSNATARKVIAQLNRSDARIVERLLQEDISAISRARQEKLLRDIRKVVESAYKDATGALQVDLDALADYEVEYQGDLFKKFLPVQLETVAPASAQVLAAVNSRPFQGKLLKEVYSELPSASFRKVRNAIRAGIVEGRTTAQIVQEIRGTRAFKYKDGILEQNRRATEAGVRTAINHTANVARETTYERNSDLIKGVRFNATLDGRTTLVCASNDGKVFETGKGPRPPLHFNCRSSTSPVLKSWEELGFDIDELPAGTRASMDGQVSANLNYSDWLRKQDADFQDEVLGKGKGKLFRKGGLSVDKFVNRAGREYTLDELKRRESAAWAKAAA